MLRIGRRSSNLRLIRHTCGQVGSLGFTFHHSSKTSIMETSCPLLAGFHFSPSRYCSNPWQAHLCFINNIRWNFDGRSCYGVISRHYLRVKCLPKTCCIQECCLLLIKPSLYPYWTWCIVALKQYRRKRHCISIGSAPCGSLAPSQHHDIFKHFSHAHRGPVAYTWSH